MLRLLLIEDGEPDGSALSGLLGQITGIDLLIQRVASSQAALETMAQFEPDVCLMDCRAGESGEPEWILRLRKQGHQLPVVLWTTLANSENTVETVGVDYLVKETTTAGLLQRTIQRAAESGRDRATLARNAKMLAVVAGLSQAAVAEPDLSSLMDDCLAGVTEALDLEYACVLERMPHQDCFLLRAGRGWIDGGGVGQRLLSAGGQFQAGFTWLSKTPVVVEDQSVETRFQSSPLLCDHGVVSGVSVVIPGPSEPYGVLASHSRRRRCYGIHEVNFLSSLANILAQALPRCQARQQARLASILESSSHAIIANTLEGIITDWNLGAQQTYGYTKEEMIGRSIFQIVPEPRTQEARFILERIRGGERVEHFETVRVTKDGTPLDIWLTVSPLLDAHGNVIGGSSIAQDITARKVTERALSESQAQLASIIETAMNAIISVDQDQRIILFNHAAEQMFGCPVSQALGQPLARFLPERFRAPHHQHVAAFGRSTQSAMNMADRPEVCALRANGEEFPIEASISQLDVQGKKLYTAIIRDVTQRKKNQQKLAQSEAQFRALFDNALDAVLVADDQARYVDANPAACSLLGVTRQQILGSRLHDYCKPGSQQQVSELWQAFLVTGLQRGVTRIFRPDGVSLVVDYTAAAHFVPGLHLSILRDVSEQRKLEEQFRQSQKLEAIGQLAGGIAHDFNNLLMVILGYADIALLDVVAEHPLKHHLQEIHQAASRASSLTSQLLAFSRKQILQPRVLDLNQILSDLQAMLARLIGENIQLQTSLSPTLPCVRADTGQIQQLIMNLVVNARDAMPEGGQIRLETLDVTLDEEYVSQHLGVQPGRYAVLSVTDSGVGMSKETQKRIFEPFFTTKGVGKGTGLGLSTVFGIVQQAGGNTWVNSEIGLGSVFKVYLPGLDQPAESRAPTRLAESSLTVNTETILLVEDDEALRRLIQRVFVASGYTLLIACDGPSALSIAAQHQQTIHLLLTDVVMPGMPGNLLADRLRSTRPEMKVLFMSGYTADAVIRHGIQEGQTNFIQKPFSPAQLYRKIQVMLDE